MKGSVRPYDKVPAIEGIDLSRPSTRKIAEAIEDIPAGESFVIDFGLGLAARLLDADRGAGDG